MSETCAIGTNSPVSNTGTSRAPSTCRCRTRIAIRTTGASLPQGASGEICIAAPTS